MKKYFYSKTKPVITLLLFLLAFTSVVKADPVNIEEARMVAKNFLNNNGARSADLIRVFTDAEFPNVFVFTTDNSFVLVASDDCVQPILGYSLNGGFDMENMPENKAAWIKEYCADIRYAVDHQVRATSEVSRMWNDLAAGVPNVGRAITVVEPLIQTKWNQGNPYKLLCPSGSVTGCVATAMAQVMKYWNYPSHGIGSHSYNHATYGELSADFQNTTYEWNNMTNTYNSSSTDTQKMAVATLMFHCGVSVDMNYSPSGSGAVTSHVADALKSYFNYSSDVQHYSRSSYDDATWISMLKSDLDLNRPIQYHGSGSGGGHSFVFDGYNSNDYFHVNWGWGGSCDEYYTISNLNPGPGGIGSGSYGVYNEKQGAILGVHPSECSADAPTNLTFTQNGRYITLSWSSAGDAASYNIYRGSERIGNVSTTSFPDIAPYGTSTYYVRSVDNDGRLSLSSETVIITVNYVTPIVDDLTANISNNDVNLSWTAPEWCYPQTPTQTISYGEDPVYYSFGVPFYAHRYPASMMSQYNNNVVYKIASYFQYPGTYTVYIYTDSNTNEKPLESALAATKSIDYVGSSGWYDIVLDNPVILSGDKDLWVVMRQENVNQSYPVPSFNLDSHNANACYYGSSSTSLYDVGYDISWFIKTYITDGTYTYNIYNDNVKIAQNQTGSSYSYNETDNGFHKYHVTTNYFGKESQPSNSVTITLGVDNEFTGKNETVAWSDPDNWSNGEPDENSNVLINNDVLINEDVSVNSMYINENTNVTVAEGATLTISSNAQNLSGTDGLVLESGANLVTNTSNLQATVKRVMTANTKDDWTGKWHFLSSPVAAAPIADFVGNADGQNYDLYIYNEPNHYWYNEKANDHNASNEFYKTNGTVFMPGRGYLTSYGTEKTMSFNGVINSGEITIPVTASLTSNLQGFNLIGNPYPCSIDWNATSGWSRDVLGDSPYIWIYDDDLDQYGAYQLNAAEGTNDVTNIIASCQGFFVKATTSGNISVDNDVKTADPGVFRKEKNNKSISIKVSGKNGSDEVMICLTDQRFNNAEKLYSRNEAVPSLYLNVDNDKYSIVNVTENENITIPLGFECGTTGKFTISSNSNIELVDKLTGNVTNLSSSSYEFIGSNADNYDRFLIRISNNSENEDFVYHNGDELILSGNGQVQVIDCLGRVVINEIVNNGRVNVSGLKTGVYVVRMNNKNQKIILR